jgi:hypothetical protein
VPIIPAASASPRLSRFLIAGFFSLSIGLEIHFGEISRMKVRTLGLLASIALLGGMSNVTQGAFFVLTLDDLNTAGVDRIIIDQAAGGTTSNSITSTHADLAIAGPTGLGQILYASAIPGYGAVGSWDVNVTTGMGAPLFGGPLEAAIDLNSVSATTTAGGPHVLQITLSQIDFTLPVPAGTVVELFSSIGGTTQGSIDWEAILDLDNLPLATVAQGESSYSNSFTSTPGDTAFDDDAKVLAILQNSPFSLTQRVTITHNGAGTTSFDYMASVPVPEPTSIALFCTGALGLLTIRRRSKQA